MTDRLTIQNLKAKDPSISNREIARRLNISHHTVEAALRTDVDAKYSRKEKPNLALERFRDIITEMAVKKKLIGSMEGALRMFIDTSSNNTTSRKLKSDWKSTDPNYWLQ